MHGARPIGNASNWPSIPAFKSALVRSSCTPFPRAGGTYFPRIDPTENKKPAIICYSPPPRFFDFNTFNAQIINGSTPFSISVFLLSSLMSTGTPLPS